VTHVGWKKTYKETADSTPSKIKDGAPNTKRGRVPYRMTKKNTRRGKPDMGGKIRENRDAKTKRRKVYQLGDQRGLAKGGKMLLREETHHIRVGAKQKNSI